MQLEPTIGGDHAARFLAQQFFRTVKAVGNVSGQCDTPGPLSIIRFT
jgi:hypothetical protein